jgi:hypothetical protein
MSEITARIDQNLKADTVTKQGPGGGASQFGWGGEHGAGGGSGIRAGELGGQRSLEKCRAGEAIPFPYGVGLEK